MLNVDNGFIAVVDVLDGEVSLKLNTPKGEEIIEILFPPEQAHQVADALHKKAVRAVDIPARHS